MIQPQRTLAQGGHQFGGMRGQQHSFTRMPKAHTHAFSKEWDNPRAAWGPALIAPSMAAGITDDVWTLDELIANG
jgi:hypothetical protein